MEDDDGSTGELWDGYMVTRERGTRKPSTKPSLKYKMLMKNREKHNKDIEKSPFVYDMQYTAAIKDGKEGWYRKAEEGVEPPPSGDYSWEETGTPLGFEMQAGTLALKEDYWERVGRHPSLKNNPPELAELVISDETLTPENIARCVFGVDHAFKSKLKFGGKDDSHGRLKAMAEVTDQVNKILEPLVLWNVALITSNAKDYGSELGKDNDSRYKSELAALEGAEPMDDAEKERCKAFLKQKHEQWENNRRTIQSSRLGVKPGSLTYGMACQTCKERKATSADGRLHLNVPVLTQAWMEESEEKGQYFFCLKVLRLNVHACPKVIWEHELGKVTSKSPVVSGWVPFDAIYGKEMKKLWDLTLEWHPDDGVFPHMPIKKNRDGEIRGYTPFPNMGEPYKSVSRLEIWESKVRMFFHVACRAGKDVGEYTVQHHMNQFPFMEVEQEPHLRLDELGGVVGGYNDKEEDQDWEEDILSVLPVQHVLERTNQFIHQDFVTDFSRNDTNIDENQHLARRNLLPYSMNMTPRQDCALVTTTVGGQSFVCMGYSAKPGEYNSVLFAGNADHGGVTLQNSEIGVRLRLHHVFQSKFYQTMMGKFRPLPHPYVTPEGLRHTYRDPDVHDAVKYYADGINKLLDVRLRDSIPSVVKEKLEEFVEGITEHLEKLELREMSEEDLEEITPGSWKLGGGEEADADVAVAEVAAEEDGEEEEVEPEVEAEAEEAEEAEEEEEEEEEEEPVRPRGRGGSRGGNRAGLGPPWPESQQEALSRPSRSRRGRQEPEEEEEEEEEAPGSTARQKRQKRQRRGGGGKRNEGPKSKKKSPRRSTEEE